MARRAHAVRPLRGAAAALRPAGLAAVLPAAVLRAAALR
ncbi:hypothetical protein L492_1410, partial [Bordetella bronchiseptica 7E71]